MVEKGLEARPEMRPFVEKIGVVPYVMLIVYYCCFTNYVLLLILTPLHRLVSSSGSKYVIGGGYVDCS